MTSSERTGPLGGGPGRRLTQYRVWLAVAVAVLLCGTALSVVTARAAAAAMADSSRRQFARSSAETVATFQLAFQRQEDLFVNAAGFIAANPNASNATLAQWANSVTLLERYPELVGFGHVVLVPAAQLPAFAASATADPAGKLPPGGTFQVEPDQPRPFYCLASAAYWRDPQRALPAGYDYCQGDQAATMLASRDSNTASYVTLGSGNTASLMVLAPVYRAGVPVLTVPQRQAAFEGWIALTIVPDVILDHALGANPPVPVKLRFHSGATDITLARGAIPRHPHVQTTDLASGWTLQTFGKPVGDGIFDSAAAASLLLAGVAISALLAGLVFLLATGRLRALRLVDTRTDQLRHQALHDGLTGLPNRALIMDRIAQLLAHSRRDGTLGAALYLDLDGFKNVNDTLGHSVGDRVLRAVAERLTTGLRDADTIGRMGGDEFVILVDGATLASAPELVAERLLEIMRQPFEIEEVPTPVVVTVSVGIAVGSRQEPGELLRQADVALYEAKAAGKNCYEMFRAEMGTDLRRRYELEFDLRSALDRGQFRLFYQPIYRLADLTLVGVEALIRWQHPTFGMIQPNDFIPQLESNGRIIEVGRWVLEEATRQLAQWRRGGSDLTVAVNVSGRQVDRDVFVEHVREALESSGLEPAALTIEITETAIMQSVDATAARLGDLKALGVKIAIDDFGTGYSSMAYLQRLPIDCIKIDRTFVESTGWSRESDAMIHTLVQLGRDLGLTTVAEGVEETRQLDRLRHEQVDQVQGFLLARPSEPKLLESLLLVPARQLADQRHRSPPGPSP